MVIRYEQLKLVINDYSKNERIWHLFIWIVGLVTLNLPLYNLSVGPFTTDNSSLLVASLYALPLNVFLFYGNVVLMQQHLLQHPMRYLRHGVVILLIISAIESIIDSLLYHWLINSLTIDASYEIALGNVILNLFFFMLPSWLYGLWRVLNQQHQRTTNIETGEDSETPVLIPEGKKQHKLLVSKFLYAKSEGNYCDIVCIDSQLTIRISLNALIALLPEHCLQSHKSYIVNSHHLNSAKYNHVVVGEHELPLGRKYAANVKSYLINPSTIS